MTARPLALLALAISGCVGSPVEYDSTHEQCRMTVELRPEDPSLKGEETRQIRLSFYGQGKRPNPWHVSLQLPRYKPTQQERKDGRVRVVINPGSRYHERTEDLPANSLMFAYSLGARVDFLLEDFLGFVEHDGGEFSVGSQRFALTDDERIAALKAVGIARAYSNARQ